MAALVKAVRLSGAVSNISTLFSNLSLSANSRIFSPSVSLIPRICLQNSYSTKPPPDPLMEFFDDKKNWGQKTVKTGRSWKMDELRIKSNEDLHKLWYILLKERNMLMTMEHAHVQEYQYFPNPERIDKVEESMMNLENVVRERNQAYHYLETGVHGERPMKLVRDQLGLRRWYKMCQHAIPKYLNGSYRKTHIHFHGGFAVRKFLRKFNEKMFLARRTEQSRQAATVRRIFRVFPNVDIEAVREKYPNVDVDKARKSDRSRAHYVFPKSDSSP
ncbi:39S ribosomal protein L47, mitochondrial [Fopius arisanus]|uniref:Large ribosomal subunit protein uL29m n=1 Tax=Fopius arisanus TaxID=64838 RepID=A0A9R1U3T2_9HYME|nr:PREDICTED: 39S ribosomal protein L47, mitochondrial [Fopius arisanus]